MMARNQFFSKNSLARILRQTQTLKHDKSIVPNVINVVSFVANINAADDYGDTPLDCALGAKDDGDEVAQGGNYDATIALLLPRGTRRRR